MKNLLGGRGADMYIIVTETNIMVFSIKVFTTV